MIEKLQAEILKAQDNLHEIVLTLGNEKFVFYYRYITLLEQVRIEQACIKPETTINADGSQTTEYKKQEHLVPITTILEKALDKDGKRLFSLTDPKHFKLISDLPAGASSYIAYEMGLDIMGTMKEANNG